MKIFSKLFIVLIFAVSCNETDTKLLPENYNVVWNSKSKNASESMPLVGGDIGCNVWVENGDILLYIQRSGSLDENGEYLKLGRFYPLFPFNQFQLGDEEIQYFKNAYEKAPAFRKGKVISWHQDGIQFARMGMTEEAADYNTKKLQDSQRRFPTFWGPGHDWVPDHNWGGSGMIGLQEMLMQTFDDKILLFPAWPKEWDVDFKMHAPHNTTIEVRLKDGEIEKLVVNPTEREKDVIVLN